MPSNQTIATMGSIFMNNLHNQLKKGKLCKAFGIRMVPSISLIQIAKHCGFDSLFIDLEHSTFSLENASQLCTAGLEAGVTPFVRVPYQCGAGFVQKVLDGGAMGVVFPHIHDRADAEAAVRMAKYPPLGKRSMTGQLPQFSSAPTPIAKIVQEGNSNGSSVFVMIETREAIQNIEEIATTPGVEVLLIGSNDLAIELGVPGQFDDPVFRSALEKVSQASKKHGKVMGLAGIYDKQEIHDWAVNTLGIRWLLGGQDSAWIVKGARQCATAMSTLQK